MAGSDSRGADLDRLHELQSPCRLCPRGCGARRAEGEVGHCRVGTTALVASAGPHFGEEPVLVGAGGSGTIFLGGCNLLCLFCQNYDISHGRAGGEASPGDIAQLALALESRGCLNVNFVTPTHFAPQLAEAVGLARSRGLSVPVVWNCGGYESVEALRELEGSVEIYMPDAKTLDADFARCAMGASDYPERMGAALVEMQRQVGDLVIEEGLAVRGLLIRHLVMPGMLDDSRAVLDMIARDVSADAYVNVMGQYRPCFRAREVPGLGERPSREEIAEARAHARSLGLRLAE
ncbi:MAG: radical SAM protein [Planctomycetota bacterium]|jgi:putative pyruvate formate lyase activating enzyme